MFTRSPVVYPIAGWLLIQVATQVFPFFDTPNWAIRFVVLVIAISFLIVLIIASPVHGADDDL